MRTFILAGLILLFSYPFLVYPPLLALWAKLKRRNHEPEAGAELPRVALIICALNEQGIVREKIENSRKWWKKKAR